jgi:hypothetical protein
VNDCRNISKKATENEMKKATLEEASTSIRRRRRGKSSSKKTFTI